MKNNLFWDYASFKDWKDERKLLKTLKFNDIENLERLRIFLIKTFDRIADY